MKQFYGDVDDPEREEIIPPLRKRQKGSSVKVRAVNERKPLMSRLMAWRAGTHSSDPLAPVRPPSFIIDNQGIKTLARLHPSNITHPEQIVSVLDQTPEWQDLWSRQIFKVIQAYDQELADCRKGEAARNKASQKRAKQEQDQVKFAEVSNGVAERIRQEILSRHTPMVGKVQSGIEAPLDVENSPIHRSSSSHQGLTQKT